MIVDTPILRYAKGWYDDGDGDDGHIVLCRNSLRQYFYLGRCKNISVRISDAPSRGSTAVRFRFRYRYDNGPYYPECRVVGWREDWQGFLSTTNKWLEENIPVLARLKKSKAKKPRSILLHITIYIHES